MGINILDSYYYRRLYVLFIVLKITGERVGERTNELKGKPIVDGNPMEIASQEFFSFFSRVHL